MAAPLPAAAGGADGKGGGCLGLDEIGNSYPLGENQLSLDRLSSNLQSRSTRQS